MTAATAALLSIATPSFAQTTEARPPPQVAMDPALRQALMSLATALAVGFAANLSSGSQEGFDPGPILEKTVRNALAGNQLDQAVDALLASALKSEGGAALPAELRVALALAAKALFANVRREALRDLGASSRP
ncbi:MAG: hypothetical protein JNM79_21725 [Burkholderiales bacterium]|nr:hypothetical protein [Burkholderiales bacterium]